jgi:hypothetical protein
VIQYTTLLSTWYQSTGSESPYIYFFFFYFPHIYIFFFPAPLVFSGKYFALSFSVLFLLVVSADQYTAGNLGRRPFQSCRTQPNRSFHAPSRAARSSGRSATAASPPAATWIYFPSFRHSSLEEGPEIPEQEASAPYSAARAPTRRQEFCA